MNRRWFFREQKTPVKFASLLFSEKFNGAGRGQTMDDGRETIDDGRETIDDGRWTMDERR